MKKIISVMLVLCTLFGITACSAKAEELYIIKGEFYNLFLKSFNYYSVDGKEFDETDNYDIEAQAMVDWNLLPEKTAFKKLNKAITKEEATLICFNSVYIKKQGNKDEIKDVELCKWPQEMADAVAMGIAELNNGYFNGKEKLSYQDCEKMIRNTMKAKSSGEYAEDQGSINYAANDNAISFSAEDIDDESSFSVEGYTNESAESNEPEKMNNKEIVKPSFLNYKTDNNEKIKDVYVAKELFNVKIPKKLYDAKFSKAQKGDYIVYTGTEVQTSGLPDLLEAKNANKNKLLKRMTPFVGYLCKATKVSENVYNLLLEKPSDEEIMANTDVTQKTIKIENIDFNIAPIKILGYKISIKPNSNKDGVSVSASKVFTASKKKYGNWRDQKADFTVTMTSSIENMTVTMDNFKHFFRDDKTDAYMKFSCTTTESFELKTNELRLAPDSNRNGKFDTNLLSSRFTDGKGAEDIKIATFPVKIPYTGITFNIGVYLTIRQDGKIEIVFSQVGNGFELKKTNGKCTFSALEYEDNKSFNVETNLKIGIKTKIQINFLFVKNVLSGYFEFGMDITAVFSAYNTKNNKEVKTASGYYDMGLAKADSKLKFCFDISGKVYISGGLENDNLIGKLLKDNYDISKFSFMLKGKSDNGGISLPEFSIHIEETGTVEKCTHGGALDTSDEVKSSNSSSEKKFLLESTKLAVIDGTCNTIRITGMPISQKKINKNYVKGIQVRVKDKTIAEATYSEATSSIVVSSLKPGSTEVEVFVQKDKRSGKEYMQTFSITVYENPDMNYVSFAVNEDVPIQAIKL